MPFSLSSWFFRQRVHAEVRLSGRPVASHRVVNPYHAVRIVHQSGCCRQVLEFDGLRLLANAAPRLPLADCNAPTCRCRYLHLEDRRSGEDRRESSAGPHPYLGTRNRRLSQGRRAGD